MSDWIIFGVIFVVCVLIVLFASMKISSLEERYEERRSYENQLETEIDKP